jgi:hypothetical protein
MMDLVQSSPLVDLFRRGEVPRDVRLLAAQGVVAPRAHEQLAILVLLTADRDAEVARAAAATIDGLPRPALESFLARRDVPEDIRAFFAARGIGPGATPLANDSRPLVDVGGEATLSDLEAELEDLLGDSPAAGDDPASEASPRRQSIATLPVIDKIKLAMRGSREQRMMLIRDANKLVSTSVLSSPKLTDSEVESFARMANVSDEVLRIIGTSRNWTKSYAVTSALTRNPKTPPAVSMPLVARLTERDLKGLSTDRNVPEGLRLAARKLLLANQSRRQ